MAQKNGQSPPPRPTPYPIPEPIHPDSNALPTVLFNGMIAPLMPFAIKGVIWYQGESNGGGVPLYRKLFPAMITDWRKHWGIGDFPFLYVQLPNYGPRSPDPDNSDGGWPGIRETQMLALKTVPNTGMAVTIEAGDGKNLHPPYKDIVGHRLALVARRLVYGEEIDSSGPMYDSFKVEGDKIRITFKNVDKGLKIGVPPHVTAGETPPPKDELKGFAISGTDNKFVWAKAEIAGPDAIVVSAESVKNPANVRYGWAADPVVNLYNSADLPASPFRTDPPAAK